LAVIVASALLATPSTSMASGEHGGGGEHDGGMAQHMGRMDEFREVLKQRMGHEYEMPVRAAKSGEAEKGKQVFETYCVTCHGASGKGDGVAAAGLDPKPADFTDSMHANFYSDAGRLEIIRSGSPGSAMVAWKGALKDEQIMAVFQYVRALRPEKATEAHHADHAGSESVKENMKSAEHEH